LIQQTQYTPTTCKYNFPLTGFENSALPQRFTELSLRSIKNIHNKSALYQPYESLTEEPVYATDEVTLVFQGQTTLKLRTIPVKPCPNEKPVIAIDVSSIKIGETNRGIILALRAATVWKQRSQGYRYLRLGPFPFHITEENKQEIYSLFRQFSVDQPEAGSRIVTPDTVHIQTRMTTLLERWLQIQITKQSRNSLILLDGSLTAGTNDTSVHAMSQLLDTARNYHNIVLAFTKITRLRLNGYPLTDLVNKCTPPCLLQTDGYPTTAYSHIHFLGAIYVAKLNHNAYAFRLDIDNKIPHQQAVESVEHLIANDLVADGYPETLRLAHIYSTFTANEVIGIQRFLTQTHGIRIIQRPSMRRLLFGPFGKGPSES
jgi:hypothetical protein